MNVTKCPNLVEWVDWVILLCEKGNKPYIPDLSELKKYCKNNNYSGCPYYSTTEEMPENTGYHDIKNNQKKIYD